MTSHVLYRSSTRRRGKWHQCTKNCRLTVQVKIVRGLGLNLTNAQYAHQRAEYEFKKFFEDSQLKIIELAVRAAKTREWFDRASKLHQRGLNSLTRSELQHL